MPETNENILLKIVAYASIVVVVLGALLWIDTVVLEGGEDSVNVDIIDTQYRYNEVEITFQTYNEGFFSARNVKVKISVIEDTGERGANYNKLATGDILGSKTYFVGTIKGGESKTNTLTIRLDETPDRISMNAQIVK